jgi:Serine/threonine protein kinase
MFFNQHSLSSNTQPQEIFFNNVKYQVGEFLGSGLTSEVYSAVASVIDIDKQVTHQNVALKSVKVGFEEEFVAEAKALSLLTHPNIIKMIGFKAPSKDDSRKLLALEYCKYELFDIITEIGGFTEDIGRYFWT